MVAGQPINTGLARPTIRNRLTALIIIGSVIVKGQVVWELLLSKRKETTSLAISYFLP
jgi:hypothetical protein